MKATTRFEFRMQRAETNMQGTSSETKDPTQPYHSIREG